uniref:ABC transporter domain-containing protein n=1 Tax=Heliothis virescens TaxID=7102 RepID=A0A2A4JHG4_HELVI
MRSVEKYLNDDKSEIYPKQKWEFDYTVSPIDLNLLNTSSCGIVELHFQNNESFSQPNLEYTIRANTIRVKNKLDKGFNSFFNSFTPTEEVAPQHLGTLQWAVDKAYIQRVTDQNVGQDVQMLEIPKYISEELKSLHKFIIICTIVAPLPFFLSYSAGLIEERRSGLRELMKLSGVCSDVLRFSHILETTIIGFFYALPVAIVLKITSEPILPHSNFFLLALTILQHFVNTMALAFVTTALSQDFHLADFLGFLLYMSTFILDFIWYSYKEYKFIAYLACCILPHAPVYLYWDEVLYLETIGKGSQFSNMSIRHADNCMSVSRVWLFFYIQLAFVTTLAWYLDMVRPGHYGVSKKWNFMFKVSFWCPKKIRRTIAPDLLLKSQSQFIEKAPKKAEMAIQVYKVSKVFKQSQGRSEVVALDSVTFDCYRGEVTMLLGPNGAGKTTLMLIVAGMFRASKGTVYVNGMNVAHRVMELREDVGLCMQENICFRYLTVRENITFFRKLKRKLKEGFTVDQLLKKLKLSDVSDHYSSQLSSGTLRCLQVACVLAGDADVLVLDEPTTGMDIDVRHRLWDLLMVLRGRKTILMTTSCLEEANALGERIVILSNGTLKCHGTPTFLKNTIGASFNLSVVTHDSTHIAEVKDIVESIITEPNSTINGAKRITFSLPCKEYRKFPELFQALEAKKQVFGIDRMDVGMYMEEVFSSFIEKSEKDYIKNDTDTTFRHFTTKKYQGLQLTIRQIQLLQLRIIEYFLAKRYQFVVLRIIVPVMCLIIVTLTTNHVLRFDKIFSHHISSPRPRQLVYNVGPLRRSAIYDGMTQFPGVEPIFSEDIDKAFSDPKEGFMTDETIGFKITDNYTKIFHPLNPRRVSQSVNMFSNLYISMFLPFANNYIQTNYEPLMDLKLGNVKEPKSTFLCLKWTSWVTFLAIIPLTPIIILCIKERKCGIRDNHMMAGCTPFIHWLSKLSAHMLLYSVIIVIPVILISVLLDFDRTFQQGRYLGSIFAMLLMFGLAFLSQLYLLSFILHESLAISQIYITCIFFGVVLPLLLAVLEPSWRTSIYVAIPYIMLVCVGRTSPSFALGAGLGRLTLQARLNAYCSLNRRLCPDLIVDDYSFDTDHCCNSPLMEPFPYLTSYDSGLIDFINLMIHFILFGITVILLEYKIPQYLYEQFSSVNYKIPEEAFHDENVKKEKTHVQTMIRSKNHEDKILLVGNLHKDYKLEVRKKRRNAVRGVSFAAKLGECLAILGSQATGKSSVLNMCAGNLVMTRGKAIIQRQHIRINRLQYIHKISLTSSGGGLDDFMTGHQNLMFIAQLKGYSVNKAHRMSAMALRHMGLHVDDTVVSAYSSGSRRRLCLCNTMVLAPTVAFLDEPMRALDHFYKPLVAKALQRLMAEPATVVVAETSVDWRLLQSVITRIAIMSKGQFAAIGPAEQILQSVAKGYTARIKLRLVTAYRKDKYRVYVDDEESSDSDSDADSLASHSQTSLTYAQRIVDFKKEFLKAFRNSRLTGEHLSMLYFYIEDDDNTQLYSELFTKLQEFKEVFDDVVEDYYLSATTLEDVFWRLEHEKVPADEIETLKRFRDHSEPVYIFILNGKVTKVFRGVDTVRFAEVMRKELDYHRQQQAGVTLDRPVYELNEPTPDEMEWISATESEKEQEMTSLLARRSARQAVRKRHRATLMVPHLTDVNFVLFWPHCVHAHPELYEQWDANSWVEFISLKLNLINLNVSGIGATKALVRRILYEEEPSWDEGKSFMDFGLLKTAFDRYKTFSPTREEFNAQRRKERELQKEEQRRKHANYIAETRRLARLAKEEAFEAKRIEKEQRKLDLLKAGDLSALEKLKQEPDDEISDDEEPEGTVEEEEEESVTEEEPEEYLPPPGLLIPGFYAPPNDIAKSNGLAVLFPRLVHDRVTPQPEFLPQHVLVLLEISKRHKAIEAIKPYRHAIIHMGIFKASSPYKSVHIAYSVKQYDTLDNSSSNLDQLKLAFMLSVVVDVPLLHLMDLNPVHVSRDCSAGEQECAAMFPVDYGDEYPQFEDFD